jgi:hypothetical protein
MLQENTYMLYGTREESSALMRVYYSQLIAEPEVG